MINVLANSLSIIMYSARYNACLFYQLDLSLLPSYRDVIRISWFLMYIDMSKRLKHPFKSASMILINEFANGMPSYNLNRRRKAEKSFKSSVIWHIVL